jgi:hypothetical protein
MSLMRLTAGRPKTTAGTMVAKLSRIPGLRENGWVIMGSVKRRYSVDEFARRGDAIYEKDILPKLATKDVGKFLAIDIETGEYEISADEMKAGDKLLKHVPDAQIWMVRVGYRSVHSFGGRAQRRVDPLPFPFRAASGRRMGEGRS